MGVLKNFHRSAATLRAYHEFIEGESTEFNQMRKLDLASLNLFIVHTCDLQHLNTASARERFLRYFEPSDLTITVLPFVTFTKKKSVVVDLNSEYISHVKRLHIIGPCSLQFRPEMESLTEVRVSPIEGESSTCTLPHVPEANRATHRQGICCMDVRALWRKCPLVTKFNGISLKAQVADLSSFHNYLGTDCEKFKICENKRQPRSRGFTRLRLSEFFQFYITDIVRHLSHFPKVSI